MGKRAPLRQHFRQRHSRPHGERDAFAREKIEATGRVADERDVATMARLAANVTFYERRKAER